MDLVNLKDEIKLLNAETLPKLEAMLKQLTADLDAIVSRLDGLTVTATVTLKKEKETNVESNTAV